VSRAALGAAANRVGKILALVLVLTTIGCDRITKQAARTTLMGAPTHSYFAGTVRFEYAENDGAFLSLGSQLPEWARTTLLRVGVGLALATLVLIALKYRWSGLALAGASLTFGGGVSNLLDRILRGSVVDFISLGIGPIRTGIFNVADVAILVGGVLLIRGRKKNSHKKAQDSQNPL
jgi:signal peptidase II